MSDDGVNEMSDETIEALANLVATVEVFAAALDMKPSEAIGPFLRAMRQMSQKKGQDILTMLPNGLKH